MKAIKLASVFAVTAVAAAVSTATFAAEPVFSGTAGLQYDATSDKEAWGTKGEMNIIVNTGVVYIDLDMETTSGGFNIDEAYVTQGAVQFGDFDGTLNTAAAYNAGVEIEGEYSGNVEMTDLGVRYNVMPNLTVALEMKEGLDGVGAAFSFEQDMGAVVVGVSGGSYAGETPAGVKTESTAYAAGVKAPLGMATLSASYTGGTYIDAGAAETDLAAIAVGVDLAVSDALSIAAQFSSETESEVDNTEVALFYTAGDVKYYAATQSGDSEKTVIGAKASF